MKEVFSILVFYSILVLTPSYAVNSGYSSQILTKSSNTQPSDIAKANLQVIYNVNPLLHDYNINVQVNNGVATLEGAVPNQFQKDLAGQIASRYEGIKSVNNNIVVNPNTKKGSNTSAYGQQITDATITAMIKSRLAIDPDVTATNIQVVTANNVVSLTGTVDSVAEKAEAGKVAINTTGVDTVKNNLQVRN